MSEFDNRTKTFGVAEKIANLCHEENVSCAEFNDIMLVAGTIYFQERSQKDLLMKLDAVSLGMSKKH